MFGSVILAGLSPHPPIIVPEVGKGEEKKASSTFQAENRLAQELTRKEYDTLVLITPHGPAFSDALSFRDGKTLEGDLAAFGAPEVQVSYANDLELLDAISNTSRVPTVRLKDSVLWRYGISEDLDHGALVPLSFLKKHGFDRKIVAINIGFLPYLDLYAFGKDIEKAARSLNRKIAILASGDLSHRLIPGAPSGYNERGSVFDQRLVSDLSRWDVEDVVFLPPDLVEDAGECGLRPIIIMMGALDEAKVSPEVLSYEGPFGVGYCVALFRPDEFREDYGKISHLLDRREKNLADIRKEESFPVKLARSTVEAYVTQSVKENGTWGRMRKVGDPAQYLPKDIPNESLGRAGVFVSIHKEGSLRGCIGTIEASRSSIAEEIVYNAISAATEDPRFSPVQPHELPYLDYSVDILSQAHVVEDLSSLDPKKYGVIVEKGSRRGLLLPDLPGVDTVDEQISIAKKKAGISPSEKGVVVKAFTVTRYH